MCMAVAGQEIKELFEEYEAGSTPEALLVKDFDKVRTEGFTGLGCMRRLCKAHACWC